MTRPFASLCIAGLFLLSTSCTDRQPSRIQRSDVVQLAALREPAGTVLLQQSDSAFVAEPAGVAVSSQFVFVSDAGSRSVLQYDRVGKFVRRIGRRGRGPGEFSGIGGIAVLGDSAVLVADVSTGRVSLFDINSGRFILVKRVRGSPFTLSVSGDTILAGTFDAMQTESMYRIAFTDSVGVAFGPVSTDYRNGRRLKFSYPYSAATWHEGGATVGLVGSSLLYRTNSVGAIVDSTVLAARRRRGIPDGLEEKLAASKVEGSEMLLVSVLTALTSLGSSTVLVHVDFSPQGRSVSGRGFVSMVDWKTHKQCVDAEIPLTTDSRPIFSFRRDTLVVVQNVIGVPDSASATTTVRLFALPACPVP